MLMHNFPLIPARTDDAPDLLVNVCHQTVGLTITPASRLNKKSPLNKRRRWRGKSEPVGTTPHRFRLPA